MGSDRVAIEGWRWSLPFITLTELLESLMANLRQSTLSEISLRITGDFI
jgi:hypothetical protein